MLRALYNHLAVPLARLALPALAHVSSKVARGVEAREGLLERWDANADGITGSPRIWVHASSAGETLQARPLVEAIRRDHPDAAIVYSFFSPSAASYVDGWEAPDHADYVPFDHRDSARRMLEIVRPEALVLVSAELWPNLVWEATDRGIVVAQACCRFGRGAGRLTWPATPFSRDLYGRLAAIGVVAEDDLEILRSLGVDEACARVTGDTRADVTLARAEAAAETSWRWRPREPAGVVVAGSTWRTDERIVVPAIERLKDDHPMAIALIAPHEPEEDALVRLEREVDRLGLSVARWSELEGERVVNPDVVLVNRLGLLYRLYELADVGYVGGGFRGAVHNTMEPAAFGVPVVIGPRHGGPNEVAALAAAGGLAIGRTPHDVVHLWDRWLADEDRVAGRAARDALDDLAGATERTLAFFRERGLPV